MVPRRLVLAGLLAFGPVLDVALADVAAAESVTVETFLQDARVRAGSGVRVFVDGAEAGTTGSGGTLALEIAPGRPHRIRAVAVGLGAGTRELEIARTETGRRAVQILLTGENLPEEAALVAEGVEEGALDAELDRLSLYFADHDGAAIRLQKFDQVALSPTDHRDARVWVTEMFSLEPDGRIVLRDVDGLRNTLRELASPRVSIEAYAESGDGLVYWSRSSFQMTGQPAAGPRRAALAPPSSRQTPSLTAAAEASLAAFPTTIKTIIKCTRFAGKPESASKPFTVPKGTRAINLTYQVDTDEYPDNVMDQSELNDTWELIVSTTSGQPLFSIKRAVNSQLRQFPIWKLKQGLFGPKGETDVIRERLDVSALAANAPVALELKAVMTNIGDDEGLTCLEAAVDPEGPVVISAIQPDRVEPTRSNSEFVSIPRPGGANVFSRKFVLSLQRPENSVVRQIGAELKSPDVLREFIEMSILDEAPGQRVRSLDGDRYEVEVTLGGNAPLERGTGLGPRFLRDDFVYRFRVEADVAGVPVVEESDSLALRALYELPRSVARNGVREPGGDGWTTMGTNNWLCRNAPALPRVDDITGEHGRDLGRSVEGHAQGTDIDTYHFTDLAGAPYNGMTNYLLFRERVSDALEGNTEARNTVSEWIRAARQGLTNLAAQNEVSALIYHNGAVFDTLPDGWAATLMREGRLTDRRMQTLDLGLGTYQNPKLTFRNDHNDHLHIDLDDEEVFKLVQACNPAG